jgi:hypothetical protein
MILLVLFLKEFLLIELVGSSKLTTQFEIEDSSTDSPHKQVDGGEGYWGNVYGATPACSRVMLK